MIGCGRFGLDQISKKAQSLIGRRCVDELQGSRRRLPFEILTNSPAMEGW